MATDSTARVHPTAVIEGDVVIGARSIVEALCYLKGPLVIGEDTRIYPHCIIGTEGEHTSLASKGTIRIGSRTVVRELVVVQRGTGDRDTTIGDECFVMDHTHVAHDVVLQDRVTISPNAVLGGHTRVGEAATIGMGAVLHQFSTVGAGAMIGMGSVVTKDVPPFVLTAGNPATFRRLNTRALKRFGKEESVVRLDGAKVVTDDPELRKLFERFESDRRQRPLLEPKGG